MHGLSRLRFSSLPLTALLLLPAVAASAQTRRATANQVAAPSTDVAVAPLAPEEPVRFGLTLPLRNQAQLAQLLKDLNDPKSTRYHQFLSPQQFAEQFSPTDADYARAVAYAKAKGFTVTHTFGNRLLVNVSAPAATVNQAFRVRMGSFKLASENRTYHAPDTEPTIDASAPILSVEGLSTRNLPRPMLTKAAAGVHPNTTGSYSDGSFLGSDMRAAYVGNSTLDGAGQTVGLVELGPYDLGDVTNYFSTLKQPLKVPIYNVLLDVDGICGGCDDGEEAIDIQQAISMAPGLAGLVVYEAYGSGSDALTAFSQAASDGVVKQLSLSFGWGGTPSTEPGYEQVFQELNAQGQNLFIASGDSGANAGGGGYPGNSSYVTDVGGTDLTTNGAGGAWAAETAWIGSGGGWNSDTTIPTWQVPVINGANQGSPTNRNIPDVAMEANTDNYFCSSGTCQTGIGGTSLAAPRWAGFLALANEQTNGGSVGFLNPTVYSIGQSANYTSVFHDITVGNDFNSDFPTMFSAEPGFDLTSGWGSPSGQAMLNTLGPAPSASSPNFTLTASPDSGDLKQDQSATSTITFTPTNGFTGPVTLTATGIGGQTNLNLSLSSSTLSAAGQVTLNVATTSSTPAGNQLIAVTATGGGITHTAFLHLGLPDFALNSASSRLYLNQAGYVVDQLSLNAINGFGGSVTTSLSGLPAGVFSVFYPGQTFSTSTYFGLVASPLAATTSGQPLTLTATAGSNTRPSSGVKIAVSAATGTCGSGKQVDLSSFYNLPGIVTDGSTFSNGGLDGDGYAFSSELLSKTRVLNGTVFAFGSAGKQNAVYGTGQTIPLPSGKFVTLQLLATGINGAQTGQPIVVTYADGTTKTFNQTFDDWYAPGPNVNEQAAVAMSYRDTAKGKRDARQFNLYGYTFILDSTKSGEECDAAKQPLRGGAGCLTWHAVAGRYRISGFGIQ